MDKLIEMTLDGRLSLIWVAVIFILGWGVYELWSYRPGRKRSVTQCRMCGKSARYYK